MLLEPFKPYPRDMDAAERGWLARIGKIISSRAGVVPAGVHGPPLGLAQLAAVLLQRGHDVVHEPFILKAVSGDVTDAYIEKRLSRIRFDVVGLSIGDPLSGTEALRYAAVVKRAMPGTLVVAGGMQPTFNPAPFLEPGTIDVVIRGRGEAAFPAVIDALLNGWRTSSIPGACVKGAISPDRAVEIPAADLPPVDFDAVQAPRYLKRNPFANVQTSLGCPHACPFCLHASFWGATPEHRPVANVETEMRYLNDHGCKAGYIVDPAFTLDPARARRVIDMLAGIGNEVQLGFETRADAVSPGVLEGATRARLALAWLGAESGSPAVLARLHGKHRGAGKKHLEDLRTATVAIKEAGLVAGSSWILGLPGETRDTIEETLAFMKELIDLGMDIIDARALALFPGTPYHDDPAAHGLVVEDPSDEKQSFGFVSCGTEALGAAEIAASLARVRHETLAAALAGEGRSR